MLRYRKPYSVASRPPKTLEIRPVTGAAVAGEVVVGVPSYEIPRRDAPPQATAALPGAHVRSGPHLRERASSHGRPTGSRLGDPGPPAALTPPASELRRPLGCRCGRPPSHLPMRHPHRGAGFRGRPGPAPWAPNYEPQKAAGGSRLFRPRPRPPPSA